MGMLDELEKSCRLLDEMHKKLEGHKEPLGIKIDSIDGKKVNYVDKIKPSHYKLWDGVEVIDVMKATLSVEGYRGYLEGNVLKYTTRWRKKDGIQDLKKAMYYLKELINEMEKDVD